MSLNLKENFPKAVCGSECDFQLMKLLVQYGEASRDSVGGTKDEELKEQEDNDDKTKNEKELEESSEEIAQPELFFDGKVGSVFQLLSELKLDDKEALSRTFLVMSSTSESCITIRRSRYLPILVGLIHSKESNRVVREQASKALNNIVLHGAESKQNRREAMVYKLISQLLRYCELHEDNQIDASNSSTDTTDDVPAITQTVALLMKFSFNEEYRRAMCELGALQALAKLIETDHFIQHRDYLNLPPESIVIRRYAAMALTNLTFRDSNNKAALCSFQVFMKILVNQLQSSSEDLCQVTASVLRNLSWRADSYIKKILSDIDAVTSLMEMALRVQKESTLKAVLSALWNLSAHSNQNKVDICNVNGAIEFLVKMLNYQAPSGTLVIVENVGGILRNISSAIAVRDDYRVIIRKHNCLFSLLRQLSSPSLTVVSNACGTLWNLSARCPEDQNTLISLGAIDMLRSLIHSKHKMISVACSAALKNLTNARFDLSTDIADIRSSESSLLMRKRRPLESEIGVQSRDDDVSNKSYETQPVNYRHASQVDDFSGENSLCGPFDVHACHSLRDESQKNTANRPMASLTSNNPDSIYPGYIENKNHGNDVLDNRNENVSVMVLAESKVASKNIFIKNNELNEGDYPDYHKHDNSTSSEDDLHNSKTNGFRKCEESYNIDDSFGQYTETDLDQTTNYSLRFHEQGRPDIERNEMEEDAANERSSTLPASISNDENIVAVCVTSCVETPLMFSRSSSFGSVSNCSQEVGDDHSSVISEFSRGISGVISPSDLPASPSETLPSSPSLVAKNTVSNHLSASQPSSPMPVPSSSVFEDTVTIFKDENTPIQFSVATSLSSLTFDDDAHIPLPTTVSAAGVHPLKCSHLSSQKYSQRQNLIDQVSSPRHHQPPPVQSETIESLPIDRETESSAVVDDQVNPEGSEKEDCLDVDLSPEEEQAVLNACIDQGMPTVHHKFKSTSAEFAPNFIVDGRETSIAQSASINDSTINFCTEDTPISISHAASNSDLSLLCLSQDSFLQNSILPLSSGADDQDPMIEDLPDEEQEKLLNLYIATGQSLNFNTKNNKHSGQMKSNKNLNISSNDDRSSQSSTLSEVTEDLPIEEEHTLLKEMTESAILINTCSSTDDYSFLQDVGDEELSDDESENLLNQCIALGIQNVKDASERIKDSSDLENIGPPSFLAEANLENSLTNVEEITEYASCVHEKFTTKQRRTQLKERYNTYTIKLTPARSDSTVGPPSQNANQAHPRPSSFKQRRASQKDRFRTRTLSKDDFVQIAIEPTGHSIQFSREDAACVGILGSDASPDDRHCQGQPTIDKPVGRAKSGIPVVKSKPILSKCSGGVKLTPSNKLPILQRQNTFTKDEPSAIPVRRTWLANSSCGGRAKSCGTADVSSPPFRTGIPSRIKEPSPKVADRMRAAVADNPSDLSRSRWSASENSLISPGTFKATSNSNLNTSFLIGNGNAFAIKLSPSASQSTLAIGRESAASATNANNK